ncbi:MAG: hypothetical protein QW215_02330 [Ignisphaera sp.]
MKCVSNSTKFRCFGFGEIDVIVLYISLGARVIEKTISPSDMDEVSVNHKVIEYKRNGDKKILIIWC